MSVGWSSFCRSVGWLVFHNLLKGRKVSLPMLLSENLFLMALPRRNLLFLDKNIFTTFMYAGYFTLIDNTQLKQGVH